MKLLIGVAFAVLMLMGTGCAPMATTTTTKTTVEVWSGFAYQGDETRGSDKYPMEMRIKRKGNKATGKTFFAFPNDPSKHSKMAFEGVVNGNSFVLKETHILKATDIGGNWYTKDITLTLVIENGEKWLIGEWKSNNYPGGFGTMRLRQLPK